MEATSLAETSLFTRYYFVVSRKIWIIFKSVFFCTSNITRFILILFFYIYAYVFKIASFIRHLSKTLRAFVFCHSCSMSCQPEHSWFGMCPNVCRRFDPLNPELNPICYFLTLLGAHHFLYVSRIRVELLTLRLLMFYIYIYIYIYGAPILDVSRSHTTTHHSR